MLPKTLLASALLFVSPSLAEAKSASTSSAADQSSPTGSVAASGTQAAAAADPAAPMTNAERDALLQEIRDLKKRTEALEARAAASAQVAGAPTAIKPEAGRPQSRALRLRPTGCDPGLQAGQSGLGRDPAPVADSDAGRPVRRRRPVDLQRPPVPPRREGHRNARRQALRGEVRVRPVRDRASTPDRRRSGSATSTRTGVRSWRARPTPCSWTATSSPTSSTIGGRRGWFSCARRSCAGRS